MDMRFNVYDSLLEKSPEGVLGNALAEEVTANATATEFTVKLKSGLVFHDGSPVNADAVVYSFQRIMDPKNPGLAAPQLLGLTQKGIKKVDDLTVTFALETANSIFPEALSAYSCGIVPIGYDPKGGTGAIGTGPFKVTDFLPGQKGVFAKNADYWRADGGPYVDTLEIIEFADSTAQLNALLGGAADYCQNVSGAQRKVAEGAGMALLEAKTGSWIPFTMRTDIKPFSDVKVRQAFRLIVDRRADDRPGGRRHAVARQRHVRAVRPRATRPTCRSACRISSRPSRCSSRPATKASRSSSRRRPRSAAARRPRPPCSPSRPRKPASPSRSTTSTATSSGATSTSSTRSPWTTGARAATSRRPAWAPCRRPSTTRRTGIDPEWLALVEEAYKTVDDTKRNELITAGLHDRVQRGRLHHLRLRQAGGRLQHEGRRRRARLLRTRVCGLQREVPPRVLRVTEPSDRSAVDRRALRPAGRSARPQPTSRLGSTCRLF